jgi:hypothetical protein
MNQLAKLQLENKALKQLVAYGEIYVNYDSSDCDGGHSGGAISFKSLDQLYDWWEDKVEWADGPFGFDIVEPQDKQESYLYFTR